ILSARDNIADIKLKLPICAEKGARVALSRRISGRWRLIGYGIIQ
ncbi:MAG TPA: translation initiation factor IF-2 subunit gamma, partial [Methanococcaceae archaeon]|nr:translation initiation factor IF-2 subunit gamma [Methanococcaceae archaeon]